MASGCTKGQPGAFFQVTGDEIADGFLDVEGVYIGFHGKGGSHAFGGQTDGQFDAVDLFAGLRGGFGSWHGACLLIDIER